MKFKKAVKEAPKKSPFKKATKQTTKASPLLLGEQGLFHTHVFSAPLDRFSCTYSQYSKTDRGVTVSEIKVVYRGDQPTPQEKKLLRERLDALEKYNVFVVRYLLS